MNYRSENLKCDIKYEIACISLLISTAKKPCLLWLEKSKIVNKHNSFYKPGI